MPLILARPLVERLLSLEECIEAMHGVHLTNVRTAAASAVATAALARLESSRLALIGAGVQAAGHLDAMTRVLPVERVTAAAQSQRHSELEVRAVATPAEALADADVVCTVSSAREPVVTAGDLALGTH